MDKNLLKEELEKFKLFSNYNTKQTLDENKESLQVISEQYSSPEEEIFYTLARAVGGPGTNIQLLRQAFQKFQSGEQLVAVEKMMQQKPIYGYKTIQGLLKGELETDNAEDFTEIQTLVKPKGINLSGAIDPRSGQLNYNTIKVTYTPTKKPASDVPTGEMAKTKELPGVVVTGKTKTQKTTTQPYQWQPEEFPLKTGMQGPNIKKLQTALGVKNRSGQPFVDGKFGKTTQSYLDNKVVELELSYNKNAGLDETTFNQIVSPQQPKTPRQIATIEPTTEPKNIQPVVPNVAPVAPQVNIQTPTAPPTRKEIRQQRRAAR